MRPTPTLVTLSATLLASGACNAIFGIDEAELGGLDGGAESSGGRGEGQSGGRPGSGAGGTPGAGGSGAGGGSGSCGDGIINGAEECDGAQLAGQTCATVTMNTMSSGILGCFAGACRFDARGCYGGPGGASGSGGMPAAEGGTGTGGAASCSSGARSCGLSGLDALECSGGAWQVVGRCVCGCDARWLVADGGTLDDPCVACASD